MYTELENAAIDIGTEYEETIIMWRVRRGRTQIRCARCDRFFDVPADIKIDDNGYLSDSIYHFCDDIYPDQDKEEAWVVLAHLVGWGE